MTKGFLNRDFFFKFCFTALLISNVSVFYFKNVNTGNKNREIEKKVKEFAFIPEGKVEAISYLSIQNRFGEVEFTKESPSPYPWIISSHGNLLAETKKIDTLLNNLNSLKIRRQIKADKISLKNYSMNNPYLVIKYLAPGLQIIKIKIGLINDLKKVAYIQHGQSKMIFEASYRSLSMFDNNFSSFANNYPFNFFSDHAKVIELRKGKKLIFSIEKSNDSWVFRKNKKRKLNLKKVQTWLSKLSKIKNDLILDKINAQQKKSLNNSKKPWKINKITVQTFEGKVYEYDLYFASKIIRQQNQPSRYVLYDKYRTFPIVLNEDTKKLLNISWRSFL